MSNGALWRYLGVSPSKGGLTGKGSLQTMYLHRVVGPGLPRVYTRLENFTRTHKWGVTDQIRSDTRTRSAERCVICQLSVRVFGGLLSKPCKYHGPGVGLTGAAEL